MKHSDEIHRQSSVGRTLVRVGVIAGLIASAVLLARMFTRRSRRGG